MATIYPGLVFYTDACTADKVGLVRTPSTYQYGDSLELCPVRSELYIICKDGTVQSVKEPERPIGWEVGESETGWVWRVTQVGHTPEPCVVRFHSRAEPPPGRGKIGSMVIAYSREAAIYETDDDGEPEVTSNISFPVCPGAPRKIRNPFFDKTV